MKCTKFDSTCTYMFEPYKNNAMHRSLTFIIVNMSDVHYYTPRCEIKDLRIYRKARDFLRDKIFTVFVDLTQTAKIVTVKFYLQCKPHPFPAVDVAYFRRLITFSVCAIAMYRYLSSMDKLLKLLDPTGCLRKYCHPPVPKTSRSCN